jgi:hypothetical protein
MRNFDVEPDDRAKAWLESHPSPDPWVVAYDVHRCCGGGKICTVAVRHQAKTKDLSTFARGTVSGGPEFLIDARAAVRLPERFRLTVRGVGPLRHLDLDLEPEEWGDLLYT